MPGAESPCPRTHVKPRVRQLVAQVARQNSGAAAGQMTRWDTEIRSIDDVIYLYVLARRGRVVPPKMGYRAVEIHRSPITVILLWRAVATVRSVVGLLAVG